MRDKTKSEGERDKQSKRETEREMEREAERMDKQLPPLQLGLMYLQRIASGCCS